MINDCTVNWIEKWNHVYFIEKWNRINEKWTLIKKLFPHYLFNFMQNLFEKYQFEMQ